ncbi:hypothetical protein SRHO_G00260010 [Serrasalmus rhombeus]
MDIAELPAEKAVLHVLWNNDETPSPPPSRTPSSISSLDTANISSPASSHSASSAIWPYMRNISKWPTLVNRKRQRDEDVDEGRFTLKIPKRGEVNHVPDYPENYDDDVLEDQRCLLVDAMKKKGKDMELISKKMDFTFSLRRKKIVQICEEFYRVTTKNLFGNFRAALDKYAPRLLKLYRARKGIFSQGMDNLLEKLDEQTSNSEIHRRRTSLEGLPIFVRENSKKLFLTCLVTDLKDDQAPTSLRTVVNIAIVLEEAIVLTDLPDLHLPTFSTSSMP